jgi:hypothetical protein
MSLVKLKKIITGTAKEPAIRVLAYREGCCTCGMYALSLSPHYRLINRLKTNALLSIASKDANRQWNKDPNWLSETAT